jgi:hypothetical protein
MSASAYAAAAAPVAKDEFPWKYELGVEKLDHIVQHQPFQLDGFPYQMDDIMNEEDEWPYFYARPMHESFVPSHINEPNFRTMRMMNPTQRLFMEFYAPNNTAKLRAFFQLTKERRVQLGAGKFDLHIEDANLPYPSRATLENLIQMPKGARSYQDGSFASIQQALIKHPALSAVNTLDGLIQHFSLGSIRHDPTMDLYREVFSHQQNSVATPLPVGLVLFEGRPQNTYEKRIKHGQTRREVFSTSWHPDVALFFLSLGDDVNMSYKEMSRSRERVLVIHKIMSAGILGFDMQEYAPREKKEASSHHHPKPEMYEECEITVQPFVKVHEVDDNVHLFHMGTPWQAHYNLRIQQTVGFVRTIFTHLYLGDKCPCGHT